MTANQRLDLLIRLEEIDALILRLDEGELSDVAIDSTVSPEFRRQAGTYLAHLCDLIEGYAAGSRAERRIIGEFEKAITKEATR